MDTLYLDSCINLIRLGVCFGLTVGFSVFLISLTAVRCLKYLDKV